jgi:DNA polymerase-3 subunit gamma/tau
MRDALSLTDQAIAFGNGELQETGVRHMLGSVDRGHVFRLIEALAQGDGKTVVETAEGLRRDGLSAASTLEEMTAVLQGMAVMQAVPARAGADAGGDPDAAETARLAALMPADETQLLYSLCLHGRTELGLAPDEYAALTMVLLRLLAFKPSGAAAVEKKTLNEAPRREVPVARDAPAEPVPRPVAAPPRVEPVATAAPAAAATLGARPGHRLPVVDAPALNAGAASRPMAADEPEPAPTKVMAVPVRVQPPAGAREGESAAAAASHPIPPSEEGDFWYATVTQMVAAESITALARELALQSQLVARDVDQWLLRVERESLNQAGSRDKVQAALAALGHDVRIAIEIGSVVDSPARRNKQAAEERQRIAEEAIRNDPDVQSMMRDWDARIVPGTLRPA